MLRAINLRLEFAGIYMVTPVSYMPAPSTTAQVIGHSFNLASATCAVWQLPMQILRSFCIPPN